MLGTRIAVLRRAAGLSQGQLAAQLQVSPSTVGMYEQGRREPSVDILVAMARTFGVTVDYLLTGQATPREQEQITSAVNGVFQEANDQADSRPKRPFSRQELAVLFAALLMEG